VMASAAPARVSRTIVGGGSAARMVTLDRNSSIAYDAREHRFVNGAVAAQNSSASAVAKDAAKAETTREASSAGAGRAVVQGRATNVAASNMRVPENNARSAAPPSRAMAPPRAMTPPPARGSSGGGWSQGGASQGGGRGSTAGSPAHSAPSAGASHPAASGGHPH
jgi:hypothetical protein